MQMLRIYGGEPLRGKKGRARKNDTAPSALSFVAMRSIAIATFCNAKNLTVSKVNCFTTKSLHCAVGATSLFPKPLDFRHSFG